MNPGKDTPPGEPAPDQAGADDARPDRQPGNQTRDMGPDLRAVKPRSNIGHARMRASLKHKLFGEPPAPVRLGRFVLLDRLGQGGMGVVYSAYDPDLDRRVALKLLGTSHDQASAKAKDRLLREAQALARLSHPNVVPVYEVGVLDDQVFIVMEFVVGQTLRAWAAARERTWREVLDAYRQAGQGLRAAHAVDLVHRDFKPDNVQVGNDGRIRVLDFGLARGQWVSEQSGEEAPVADAGHDVSAFQTTVPLGPRERTQAPAGSGAPGAPPGERSSPAGSGAANKRLDTPLTATGAILGTPAYMPPEQFRGARVGPQSDQFSFCVSLYEGLYGHRPFAGDTVPEMRERMRKGEVRQPPRQSRVPRWIHPILCRGLAYRLADRWPSMDALLGALARDPARTRRRALVALVFATLLGVSIYSLTRPRPAAADVCRGAERELVGLWNPDRRAALEQAFLGTARPYAAEAFARVADGLDRYAGSWADMHEDACRAHQRGEQSGVLLDRRMACLERRKVALSSALTVLHEIDAGSLEHAVEVMHKLPAVEYCENIEALMAEVPPPEDPEVAGRVAALRERLSRAKALEDAGRYSDALALAELLASEAEAIGYRPVMAEVLLLEGRIDTAMGGHEKDQQAVELLHRATALGLATGMNEVALEALARGIFAEAKSNNDPSHDPREVLRPVYLAEALLERMPERTFVHALLLNNTGVVHMAAGDRDSARQAFERALAIKSKRPDVTYIELSVVQSNLSLVTPDPAKRAALLQSAGQELEAALGPEHPRTLEQRMWQSYYTLDPEGTRRIVDATCGRYAQYHPDLRRKLADCLYYLGFLEVELGAEAAAAEHLQRAAEHFPEDRLRDLARGQALLARGSPGAALEALDVALEALRKESDRWWDRKRVAEALLARGTALLGLRERDAATRALEEAAAGFERVVEINHNVETQRRLARTRIALATALWDAPQASKEDRTAATALIARALDWYLGAGPGNERQVKELEEWRRARGLGKNTAP